MVKEAPVSITPLSWTLYILSEVADSKDPDTTLVTIKDFPP